MNWRKILLLYGDVSQVNYSGDDGKMIEFDKKGNIIRQRLSGTFYDYAYEDPTHYTFGGEKYTIVYNDTMRQEVWQNEFEQLTTDYVFDFQGRIKTERSAGYGEWIESQYFYQKEADLLPFKMILTDGWEDGMFVKTYLYNYTKVDKKSIVPEQYERTVCQYSV